jgi:hypothetical protein
MEGCSTSNYDDKVHHGDTEAQRKTKSKPEDTKAAEVTEAAHPEKAAF